MAVLSQHLNLLSSLIHNTESYHIYKKKKKKKIPFAFENIQQV